MSPLFWPQSHQTGLRDQPCMLHTAESDPQVSMPVMAPPLLGGGGATARLTVNLFVHGPDCVACAGFWAQLRLPRISLFTTDFYQGTPFTECCALPSFILLGNWLKCPDACLMLLILDWRLILGGQKVWIGVINARGFTWVGLNAVLGCRQH